MGFNFNTYIAQFCIAFSIMIIVASVNMQELNDLVNGIKIETPNMVKLVTNVLLFVFVSSIFLIPSLKGNVTKLINKPIEYSLKLLDKFMK